MMPRKTLWYLALLLAIIIALALAARPHISGMGAHKSSEESHLAEIASAPLRVPERPSISAPPSSPSPPRTTAPSVNLGSEAKESAAVDSIQRPGVVGGPLVVPDSVSAACMDPGIKGAHICDKLYADLARMAKEPRDSAWSGQMEETLQAYVEQRFPDATIQNIDCRTSLCEMEVQSTNPKIVSVFPYSDPLNNQLQRDTWMESQVAVDPQIFVVIYRRR
jgi:hypothetical protein